MAQKQRLDIEVHQRGLAPSREKARGMIMAAEVIVNGKIRDKPGFRVTSEDRIVLKTRPRFVSRGGEKLAGALKEFSLDVSSLVCADVGASTGGFTDCLLQAGAQKVYAIDVGYGQLAYSLRIDDKVVIMERTNARHLVALPEKVNLVVIDASFISLKLLIPNVINWLSDNASIIALIKPQFEAGKSDVGKGGVVRDTKIHRRVINELISFFDTVDLHVHGLTVSPIKGPAGNVEFLIWLSQSASNLDVAEQIDTVIS